MAIKGSWYPIIVLASLVLVSTMGTSIPHDHNLTSVSSSQHQMDLSEETLLVGDGESGWGISFDQIEMGTNDPSTIDTDNYTLILNDANSYEESVVLDGELLLFSDGDSNARVVTVQPKRFSEGNWNFSVEAYLNRDNSTLTDYSNVTPSKFGLTINVVWSSITYSAVNLLAGNPSSDQEKVLMFNSSSGSWIQVASDIVPTTSRRFDTAFDDFNCTASTESAYGYRPNHYIVSFSYSGGTWINVTIFHTEVGLVHHSRYQMSSSIGEVKYELQSNIDLVSGGTYDVQNAWMIPNMIMRNNSVRYPMIDPDYEFVRKDSNAWIELMEPDGSTIEDGIVHFDFGNGWEPSSYNSFSERYECPLPSDSNANWSIPVNVRVVVDSVEVLREVSVTVLNQNRSEIFLPLWWNGWDWVTTLHKDDSHNAGSAELVYAPYDHPTVSGIFVDNPGGASSDILDTQSEIAIHYPHDYMYWMMKDWDQAAYSSQQGHFILDRNFTFASRWDDPSYVGLGDTYITTLCPGNSASLQQYYQQYLHGTKIMGRSVQAWITSGSSHLKGSFYYDLDGLEAKDYWPGAWYPYLPYDAMDHDRICIDGKIPENAWEKLLWTAEHKGVWTGYCHDAYDSSWTFFLRWIDNDKLNCTWENWKATDGELISYINGRLTTDIEYDLSASNNYLKQYDISRVDPYQVGYWNVPVTIAVDLSEFSQELLDIAIVEGNKVLQKGDGSLKFLNGVRIMETGYDIRNNILYISHFWNSSSTLKLVFESPFWEPDFDIYSDDPAFCRIGDLYSFNVTVNESCTWSVSTDALFLYQVNGSTWCNISGTPYISDIGVHQVNISATSELGTLTSYQNYTLIVSSIWAPYFISSPPTSTKVGGSYYYMAQCNESVTWSMDTNATWITVDLLSGVVSGTPLNASWYWVNLTATSVNGTQSSYQNFTIDVSEEELWAPDFLSSPQDPCYSVEGQIHYYNATVNESSTWALYTDAAFLSTESGSTWCNVSGTPDSSQSGTYYVNITALSDEGVLSSFQNFTLIINDTWAPTLTSTPDDPDYHGETVDYYYNATVNETSTWNLKTNAPFLSQVNGSDWCNVSGTPNYTESGTYYVNITAYSVSGTLSTYQNYTLIINDTWTPTFTSTPIENGTVGETFSYQAECNETVTWSLNTNASFLSISASGLVSGTPDETGVYEVNISATSNQGLLTAYQAFMLTIVEPEPTTWAPIISTTPVTSVLNNSAYSYDCDTNETANFSLSTNAGFLSISATGVVSGTANLAGSYWVNITATSVEGGESSYQNYTLVVVSWNPTFTTTPITYGVYGTAYSYDCDANETVTFTMSSDATFLSFDAGTGVVSGTPDFPGSNWVNITARNSVGGMAFQNYTLIINDTWKPTLNSPEQNLFYGLEGQLFYYNLTANETCSWSLDTYPSFLNSTHGDDWINVSGIPSSTDAGEYFVIISAKSVAGTLTAYDGFNLVINDTWTPSFLTLPDYPEIGLEDEHYYYNATVNETVTWHLQTDAPFLSIISGEDWANVSGTPLSGDSGTYYVNLSAESLAGTLTGFQNYTLVIGNAWKPSFTSIPNDPDYGLEGRMYWYNSTVNESSSWSIDTNAAFISVVYGDTWCNISGTPSLSEAGTYYMNITARSSLGFLSSFQNFTIIINDTWAPFFLSLPSDPEHLLVETPFHFNATVNESVVWTLDTDAPFLSMVSGETWANVSGTPSSDDAGVYTVNITATSERGTLSAYLEFTLIVGEVWAPSIEVYPEDPGLGRENQAYFCYIEANESSVWGLLTNAPFLNMESGEDWANVSGTPSFTEAGIYFVNISVESVAGALTIYLNYTLVVGDTWAPAFTSTPIAFATVQIEYLYDAECNESVSFMIITNATWLTVSSAQGSVSGTPSVPGWFWVNITATSESGTLSSFQNFTVIVEAVPVWSPTFITVPDDPEYGRESISYQQTVEVNESCTWSLITDASFLSHSSGLTSITVSGTPTNDDAGTYFVNISATSISGKLAANLNYTLIINDTWASTFVSIPAQLNAVEGSQIWANVTTNESCSWSVDTDAEFLSVSWGSSWCNVSGTPSINDAGAYYVNFTTTSINGLLPRYRNITLTVEDALKPSLIITFPSDGQWTNVNSLVLTWEEEENSSTIKSFAISIDDGEWTEVGLVYEYLLVTLKEGTHSIAVRGADELGQMDLEVISLHIDLTIPSLQITSPLSGEKLYSSSITIHWLGDDSMSGILRFEIRMDEGSWIDLGVVYSYTIDSLDDGEHTVEVRAYDNVGNNRTVTLNFEVDASSSSAFTTNLMGAFIILAVIIMIPTAYMLTVRRRRL